MVVLVIIAILVVMAVPLFVSTRVTAAKRTCLANQRELEGMAAVWVYGGAGRQMSDLAGLVDGSHPLASALSGKRPPRCPAAGDAVDPLNPTAGEGAYTFDTSGTLEGCTFGDLGPHNHY
jgi:type II secretory pathway pseudopilin PulG